MQTRARYNSRAVRDTLLARGGPNDDGFIRYAYRPFDIRWLYWEADTKLLNEKRPDYRPHVFDGNIWLSAVPHLRKDATQPQACITQQMACLHLIERGANMFPAYLHDDALGIGGQRNTTPPQFIQCRATLSPPSRRGCRGPLPPRPRHPPRSRLPRGQRRGAPHGMAAHPAAGLARW